MRNWIANLSDRGELILMNLLCFGWFTIVAVLSLVRGRRLLEMSTSRALLGIGMEITLAFVAAQILRIRGWTATRLGLRPSWGYTFAGLALYFITFISTMMVLVPLAQIAFIRAILMTAPRFHATASWLALVPLAVATGAYEETFVTAYNVQATGRNGPAFAISFSTVVRVLYHLYQGPSALLTIGMMGLAFAAVYWRWRAAWPLIVAHAVWDLFAFASYR